MSILLYACERTPQEKGESAERQESRLFLFLGIW